MWAAKSVAVLSSEVNSKSMQNFKFSSIWVGSFITCECSDCDVIKSSLEPPKKKHVISATILRFDIRIANHDCKE